MSSKKTVEILISDFIGEAEEFLYNKGPAEQLYYIQNDLGSMIINISEIAAEAFTNQLHGIKVCEQYDKAEKLYHIILNFWTWRN